MTTLTTVAKTNSGFAYVNNLTQFSTMSSTYVDVTGVTLSVPNNYSFGIVWSGQAQSAGNARLLLGATTVFTWASCTTHQVYYSGVLKNGTGSTQTAKLQFNNTGGGSYSTYFDTNLLILACAPYVNYTDLNIKCSVDTITMLELGSGLITAAFGVPTQPTDYAPTTVTVSALAVGGIVFSQHQGSCLYDWGGTLVKI